MTDAHEDSNASADLAVGGYEPGHPWHYLQRGDGALPVAADAIPVANVDIASGHLARQIPKDPCKRDAAVERLFAERAAELAGRIARYEDVVARGVEALSRYNREIAMAATTNSPSPAAWPCSTTRSATSGPKSPGWTASAADRDRCSSVLRFTSSARYGRFGIDEA